MAETAVEPIDDNVDELLPFDEFPPTEEETLADFADDTLFEPEPVIVEREEPQPIGKSWAFNFLTNRFYPTAGGGPQETRRQTTLRFWVEKCLRTERASYPIYSDDYGVEGVNDLLGQALSEADVAEYAANVHEALTFHPNVTDVTGFQAFWDDVEEALSVSFAVITDQGEEVAFDELHLSLLQTGN